MQNSRRKFAEIMNNVNSGGVRCVGNARCVLVAYSEAGNLSLRALFEVGVPVPGGVGLWC